jgi:hypothetical protein
MLFPESNFESQLYNSLGLLTLFPVMISTANKIIVTQNISPQSVDLLYSKFRSEWPE